MQPVPLLALVHDVLVVLAFYAVAQISVGNTFIACMLTIVGYSINATIVIFDRIRENLADMKTERTIWQDVVNTQYYPDADQKYLYVLDHLYHGGGAVYLGRSFHP